jgi:DNA-binding transcriptional MerR regulator
LIPIDDQPIYSIGAVANMLEVPASTIRAWEDRYGAVLPSRSEGAQRLYSRSQVDHLRFIKSQIDIGMSAADAHRLLAQQLQDGGLPTPTPVGEADRRPLVLLAERDQYAAELAQYFLRTEGYEVCVAHDAVQTKLLVGERSPDVVIIDLLISGGAGYRLCREIAAGGCHILAVAAIDAGDEAVLAGAAAFLQKPLEPLHLVAAVRDLMGTSATARSARQSRSRS